MSGNDPITYAAGWNAAIVECEAIARRWSDENRAASKKAYAIASPWSADEGDRLDGAAIECNAIAGEIAKLRMSA